MTIPILVTGAAGRVGAVGRTVTELLLRQGGAVRAMVRNEDERAQALRDIGLSVPGQRPRLHSMSSWITCTASRRSSAIFGAGEVS